MGKKKKKINKKKFLSRILFLGLIIVIVGFVITVFINKKDIPKFSISVIYNNEDVTNNLSDEPYINKDKVLYLSLEDIRKIFDPNIYFESDSNKIITTSNTKVAAIDVKSNIATINSASILLDNGVLDYGNNKYYIPVSELQKVYNIESYVTDNSAIMSSLLNDFATVKTTKKVSVKEKTSGFSHTIQKIEENKEIIYVEDSEKNGWIKVLTYERKFRICKGKRCRRKGI